MSLDKNWHLFIDDHILARSTGFDRIVHHPRAVGIVIPADKPWETVGVQTFFIERLVNDSFIAYYRALWWDSSIETLGNDRAHKMSTGLAYATSEDGIHWHKPNLGIVDAPASIDWSNKPFPNVKGTTLENNLGIPFVVVADMGRFGNVSDPTKRYALRLAVPAGKNMQFSSQDSTRGYFAKELPDFLNDPNWQDKLEYSGGSFSPRHHGVQFWDDIHNEWVAIEQGVIGNWLPSREIGRMASSDLIHWTGESVLYPDSLDSHIPQCYDEPMFLLPFCADGLVYGLLSWFHGDRTHPHGGPNLTDPSKPVGHPDHWPWCRKGTNDMRITISRDGGKTWDRTSSRVAWIQHGNEEDSYDRMVIGPILPVYVGDEDWFYINVHDGNHLMIRNNSEQSSYYSDRLPKSQTALYIQKHNRYVSLTACNTPEVLITKPLKCCGNSIKINVNSAHGEVRVAIASAETFSAYGGTTPLVAPHLVYKEVFDGFGFEDCQPIRVDGTECSVSFQNANIKSLQGKMVRLLFKAYNADLYGFCMA